MSFNEWYAVVMTIAYLGMLVVGTVVLLWLSRPNCGGE